MVGKGRESFAHHLRHDGRFVLGLSCESGCACHSLVASSYKQRIGLNYLVTGGWEAAGATTRGRQVGRVILAVGKESRSLWGLLLANITSGRHSSFEGTDIAGGRVTMTVFLVVRVCVGVAVLYWIAWLDSSVSQ